MQQNDARNSISEEKQQAAEQNKIKLIKKKPSLLKKKKLPHTKIFSNVDLKHVVNIGDVCFVNEDSLRNPDSSEETLLKTLYHYKMISKVTLNNSFVNIQLKKNSDNYLPPQYFVERLRSFGDQQMANIATHLENIHRQFQVIKRSCPVKQRSFARDKQQSLLQNFLQKMQGRKYFLYFSEITPQRINMKNIVFSVPLLQALGCNIKNIAMDFLKYKHVFFQVFTTKMYKFFVDKCLENFAKIQAQLMIRPDMPFQQRQEMTSFIYDDQVIRKKEGDQGIYEQISHAKVRWFSPHPSICCFQILELDEAQGLRIPKLRKINHFEESKPEEQLKELLKIGVNFPLLQIEQGQPKNQLALQPENKKDPSGANHNANGYHNMESEQSSV